ncbi:MAG: hypothetical protein R3F31_02105 [Verrucomicrobiales bacterium]
MIEWDEKPNHPSPGFRGNGGHGPHPNVDANLNDSTGPFSESHRKKITRIDRLLPEYPDHSGEVIKQAIRLAIWKELVERRPIMTVTTTRCPEMSFS